MKVAFLYPPDSPHDALVGWVAALARYCRTYTVVHARDGHCRAWADVVLLVTHGENHPRALCDLHLREAREAGVPAGVVHNEDCPGVPTPGDYPSFCWTRRAFNNLRGGYSSLARLRQPVFPAIVPPRAAGGTLVATFGHVEPKKGTLEMARWAAGLGVPFRAYGPTVLAEQYADYLARLRRERHDIRLHAWYPRVEDLAPYFEDVSHFLFVLPASKAGTGGSPTSPRYATFFNRPVLVVDDEPTFAADGFAVFPSLDAIGLPGLAAAGPPRRAWGPDAYVDALVRATRSYWEGR